MSLPTMRNALAGDLDKVFDRFWSDWSLPLTFDVPSAPSLDVFEKEDGTFAAELAIPGYKPEDMEIEISGNVLTITGKYDSSVKTENVKYRRREIRRGAFERVVTFPQEIDPDGVTAKTERGILYLTVKPMKKTANTKVKVTGT